MALGKAVFLAVAAALAGQGAPLSEGAPPLDPGNEIPDASAPTPWPECAAKLATAVNRADGQIARTLVTHSERWGAVWRADVIEPSDGKGVVRRAVCWNDQLQFGREPAPAPLPLLTLSRHKPAAIRCNYTPIDNPCRKEPVTILWLCVRPQLFLYADGHAEPARDDPALGVAFTNRGAPETDAAWRARCASKGGIYRAED